MTAFISHLVILFGVLSKSALAGTAPRSEIFDQTVRKLEKFSHPVQLAHVGQLIQTQPKIVARVKKMILDTRSELIMSTFICEAKSDLAKTVIASIQELEQNIRDDLKTNRGQGYLLPVQMRFLSNRPVGPAGHLFKEAKESAPHCFDELKYKLDPNLISFEYSNFEHSSTGCAHSKYVLRDGHEILLTSMNLAVRDFFEVGATFDSDSLAQEMREDFWKLRGDSVRIYSNFKYAKPLGSEMPNELEQILDLTEFAENPSELILTERGSSENIFSFDKENSQDASFLELIKNAKKSIKIFTPNLNFNHYRSLLLGAVKRGVDVQLILSKEAGSEESKIRLQGGTSDEVVERLWQGWRDLRMFIHHPHKLAQLGGLDVRWYERDYSGERGSFQGKDNTAGHVKFMSVDHSVLIIGSGNMDFQSWYHSRELNVVVDDPEKTKLWEETLFDPILANSPLAFPELKSQNKAQQLAIEMNEIMPITAAAYESIRHLDSGELALIEKILKKNPGSIEHRDPAFGATPLSHAAILGDVPLVRLLLKFGANPRTRVRGGLTPWDYAYARYPDIESIFLNYEIGKTPVL